MKLQFNFSKRYGYARGCFSVDWYFTFANVMSEFTSQWVLLGFGLADCDTAFLVATTLLFFIDNTGRGTNYFPPLEAALD